MGPFPGPQHSRSDGSTFWFVMRVVSLFVLAVALISVPVAWVHRTDAPTQADASKVPAPTAGELGYSVVTPTPTHETRTEPTSTALPSPTVVAPTTGSAVSPSPVPTTSPSPAATSIPGMPGGEAAGPPPAAPVEPPLVVPPPQTALTDEIIRLTNVERVDQGLPPLTTNQCLTDQSNYRTAVLVDEGRFEHDPFDPVIAACGMPHSIGENLILGYPDAASAVAAWMASTTHRETILNPDFTEIGVGCTLGPSGELCGQLFLG